MNPVGATHIQVAADDEALGITFPPRTLRPRSLNGCSNLEPAQFPPDFNTTCPSVSPAPIQRPSLPIMIAGGGERVSKRRWRATFQTESSSATREPGDTLSRARPLSRRSTIFARCEQPGIQYFIVETLDAADTETITLMAKEVAPQV
jgi:hypothetical protein